ncbi:MAG: UDP-3-O-[3-hydroxymyristoyl] N-acetylglucosamine deacetylase [Acidobacteria bacterium]|nr:MAG: UDP-3-O-[3-hydroxymyristoyl] N-acetylglucosamine deacetylase [Acidobacteriota bacterium]
MVMFKQKTIRTQVSCSGIGLHSGKKVQLALTPAPDHTGVVFRRVDLNYYPIKADIKYASRLSYATNLSRNGVSIATTEHLLGTLIGLGIDNLYVDIDAEEVPIMDGSASAFVYLINEAGVRFGDAEKKVLNILKPVHFAMGDRRVSIYPAENYQITYSIEFDHAVVGSQKKTIGFDGAATFENEISGARTFGFLKDVEMLRKNGLALGGSLDNAIVIDTDRVLNSYLRFKDEFVRHKILDVMGDLGLLGYSMRGHVVAHRAGHEIHAGLAKKLRDNQSAFEIVPISSLVQPAEQDGLEELVEVPSNY